MCGMLVQELLWLLPLPVDKDTLGASPFISGKLILLPRGVNSCIVKQEEVLTTF